MSRLERPRAPAATRESPGRVSDRLLTPFSQAARSPRRSSPVTSTRSASTTGNSTSTRVPRSPTGRSPGPQPPDRHLRCQDRSVQPRLVECDRRRPVQRLHRRVAPRGDLPEDQVVPPRHAMREGRCTISSASQTRSTRSRRREQQERFSSRSATGLHNAQSVEGHHPNSQVSDVTEFPAPTGSGVEDAGEPSRHAVPASG
jgi:hypothetical protein